MNPFADRLIHQALKNQSQVMAGLDPDITRFPAYLQARLKTEPTEQQLEEIIVILIVWQLKRRHPWWPLINPRLPFMNSMVFVLGFSTVFIALGSSFSVFYPYSQPFAYLGNYLWSLVGSSRIADQFGGF